MNVSIVKYFDNFKIKCRFEIYKTIPYLVMKTNDFIKFEKIILLKKVRVFAKRLTCR